MLSAREFGWIGIEEAVSRLEATIATLDRLERFNGHFLNWYDTVAGEPLHPRYVSTVDSGNLAGHLLAVSQGCTRLVSVEPGPEVAAGIRDVVVLIREAADRLANLEIGVVSPRELDSALVDLLASLDSRGTMGVDRLSEILADAEIVADIARTLATEEGAADLAILGQGTCVDGPRAPARPGGCSTIRLAENASRSASRLWPPGPPTSLRRWTSPS